MEELKKILKKGAYELGAGLDEGSIELFFSYLRELKAWNKRMNLTSVTGDREIVIRHFLDSLTSHRFLLGRGRLLDIGAGGGFPGIPLKIANPGLEVVLVDSVEKKVHFMRHIIRTLGLKGITAVAVRAEDAAFMEKEGGRFDLVISRAFAELKGYISSAMPYVSRGGRIIAIKGPAAEDEIKDMGAIGGLSEPEIHCIEVPFSEKTDTIIIYERLTF